MTDRRPIPVRRHRLAQLGARWLADAGVTPNQISITSVLLAGAGAAALIISGEQDGWLRYSLILSAAGSIPLRLLCNMLDGMVAVEQGKGSKSGDVYNELPDRIADGLLLTGAGYAASSLDWAVIAGWSAAFFAVLTAYVRTLGASLGQGHDFSGPFAKQQRMALLAGACLFSPLEIIWDGKGELLGAVLILIAIGSALTAARRARRLVLHLEAS